MYTQYQIFMYTEFMKVFYFYTNKPALTFIHPEITSFIGYRLGSRGE
jgi:hypothetical protein